MEVAMRSIAETIPDEVLERIFLYCPYEDLVQTVQHVCTRWYQVAHSSHLWKKVVFCPREEASDQQIVDMLKMSPKLQTVIFKGRHGEQVRQALTEHCADLRKLEICEFQCVTEEFMRNLQEKCSKLEDLSLPHTVLADPNMCEIIGQFKDLRTLHCGLNFKTESYTHLKPIADHCKKLEHLDFRNIEFNAYDLRDLIWLRKDILHTLGVHCGNATGQCILPLISDCKPTALKSLYLYGYCSCHYEEKAEHLGRLKTVTALTLEGLFNADIIHIFEKNNMGQLQELNINESNFYNDTVTNTIIENCPLIQKLTLKFCNKMTNLSLQKMHSFKNLSSLTIFQNIKITDAGIYHLQNVKNLKFLSIGDCRSVKNLGLESNGKFDTLEILNLSFQSVGFIPWNQIASHIKHLRLLNIYACAGIDCCALSNLIRQLPHLRVTLDIISQRCAMLSH